MEARGKARPLGRGREVLLNKGAGAATGTGMVGTRATVQAPEATAKQQMAAVIRETTTEETATGTTTSAPTNNHTDEMTTMPEVDLTVESLPAYKEATDLECHLLLA